MRKSDAMIRLIAVFKLVKALLLLAIAFGAFELIGHTDAEEVKRWSHEIHLPFHLIDKVAAKVTGMETSTLRAIFFGTIVYAAVFIVEGIGLWLRKVWAEYLTTIITASFIPFEIYEAAKDVTPTRIATVVINVLVVGYLVWRLRRDGHWPFKKKTLLGRL